MVPMSHYERALMLWDTLSGGETHEVTRADFLNVITGALRQAALQERDACVEAIKRIVSETGKRPGTR